MKFIQRISLLFVLIAVIGFLPLDSAQAQTKTCYGLSTADCKIISTADANTSKLNSFKQDFDFTLDFASPTTKQTLKLTAKGNGLMALDRSAMSNAADTTALTDAIQMTLNLTGTVKATGSSPLNQKGSANLVIIDGTVYAQSTDTKGIMSAWQSILLSDLSNQASAATTNPTSVANSAALHFLQDPKVLQAVALIPSIKGFITLKKTTNAPLLDGQKQIEFVYTFDVKTLLAAKEIYPIIRGLAILGGTQASTLTDQTLAATGRLLAKSLSGTTFTITRWVGAKDGLYHALTVDGTLNLDTTIFGLGQANDPPVTGALHFAIRLTKIGQAVQIKAPQ